MVIGYFEDDYYPAGGNSRNFEPSYSPSSFSSASPSLYNGNIRNIGYTIRGLTPLTIGYAYKYDQLNRLAEVKPYDTFNSSNYKWTTSGSAMTSYKEELSYDANGNILTYLRKGAPSQVNMDNMTYNYVSGTNKLVQVEDAVSASNYSIDIDQQVSTNYLYDNSGNLIKDKKEKLDITWTAYGKVDSIYNDNTDLAINFGYDASQNRLSKRVITTASSDTVTSYYIRDAQGNIMAIYELRDDTVRWIEQDLYGSSRLGVLNPDSVVYPPTTYSQFFHHLQGKKQYELTNHLGNVLTTINDRKIGQDTTADDIYDYWLAAQISGQDYYSGGMVIPERNFSTADYRFGFNTQEKVDEISGSGNHNTALFWEYNTRLGRRWNIEPKASKLPSWSPYAAMLNNPILMIDIDGDYPWPIWIRSFIYTPTTGGGLFRGDGRHASTIVNSKDITSRVYLNFIYDADNMKIITGSKPIQSDQTVFYGTPPIPGQPTIPPKIRTGTPQVKFDNNGEVMVTKNSLGNNMGSFGLHYWGKDPITPQNVTPDLDVHSSFSITENMDLGMLYVNATFTGDKFPSTEAFVQDQEGFKLFLGARKEEGGLRDLYGDNKLFLFNVDMQIQFDEGGKFMGVYDKENDMMVSPDAWNQKIQNEWDQQNHQQ